MTNIIIHGVLGKIYGSSHKFKIRKISEIIPAINANNPGFRDAILANFKSEINYNFVDPKNPKKEYKKFEDFYNQEAPKEIHIVPAITGADPFSLLFAGAIGIGAGTAIGGTIGGIIFNLGVALVLQGVSLLLFPPPEPPEQKIESKIDTSSYIFSNNKNNAVQGFPIPLAYGEIKVGSNIISTKIVSEDLG